MGQTRCEIDAPLRRARRQDRLPVPLVDHLILVFRDWLGSGLALRVLMGHHCFVIFDDEEAGRS